MRRNEGVSRVDRVHVRNEDIRLRLGQEGILDVASEEKTGEVEVQTGRNER